MTNIKDEATSASFTNWKWADHNIRMDLNRWLLKTSTWDPWTRRRDKGRKRRWAADLRLNFRPNWTTNPRTDVNGDKWQKHQQSIFEDLSRTTRTATFPVKRPFPTRILWANSNYNSTRRFRKWLEAATRFSQILVYKIIIIIDFKY